jgi:hypothetical protein
LSRPLTFRDDELLEKAWELQLANPLKPEGAICGMLGVGKEYLADRAKTSESIRELRSRMAAVREDAWTELGIKIITMPDRESSSRTFMWMTRNILGYRNGEALVEVKSERSPRTLAYRLDDDPKKPGRDE